MKRVSNTVWACLAVAFILTVLSAPTFLASSAANSTGTIDLDPPQESHRKELSRQWLPELGKAACLPKPSEREAHFDNVLEALASRQRQESFKAIFDTNSWGNAESRSGDGSTEVYTRNTRNLLGTTFKTFNITDFIDSPCGDCNWQWRIEGIEDVQYLGLDIVPDLIEGNKIKHANRTNMHFMQQDFINEPFPHQPDLILCRDMIQHNSLGDGVRAYYNMEKSGAKYLATTWHHQGWLDPMGHNVNQPPGGMYFVNIFLHPFNFSKPEFFIRDGAQIDNKTIGVWKLPALGLGDGKFFEISDHDWAKAATELVYTKDMAPDSSRGLWK